MNSKQILAAFCAAACLTAGFSGCTSERGLTSTADIEEITSAADSETDEAEVTTTEAVTTTTSTATETETTTGTSDTESEAGSDTTTTTAAASSPAVNNIILTHITEGGEGLGVFHNLSGAIRGEKMENHAAYKSWLLEDVSGYAEENDAVREATATFTYSETGGFSVNGTVEVMPADDPDYPNKMYFHSDDVDAFPRFMDDNRGEARKAKFIIDNSSDVYRMLDKDNPPAEQSFSVSVTVDTVTVRYTADGTAYDTIHVTAASNR